MRAANPKQQTFRPAQGRAVAIGRRVFEESRVNQSRGERGEGCLRFEDQRLMRVDDPILDWVNDKVPQQIARFCVFGLGPVVGTHPRIVEKAANFGMGADDVGTILFATYGGLAEQSIKRIGIGAIYLLKRLCEWTILDHDVTVVLAVRPNASQERS